MLVSYAQQPHNTAQQQYCLGVYVVGIKRDNMKVAAECAAPYGCIQEERGYGMTLEQPKRKISNLNRLVEGLCGIYSRVARRLGVHRTFVSRVARGERQSEAVENALIEEYERVKQIKE